MTQKFRYLLLYAFKSSSYKYFFFFFIDALLIIHDFVSDRMKSLTMLSVSAPCVLALAIIIARASNGSGTDPHKIILEEKDAANANNIQMYLDYYDKSSPAQQKKILSSMRMNWERQEQGSRGRILPPNVSSALRAMNDNATTRPNKDA